MFSNRFRARVVSRVALCAALFTATLIAVAIALSALASQAAAQSARSGRALTIEDYYAVKTVGAPELSPDGRWVAYTIGTRVEETNGTRNEVWLVSADGNGAARRVSAVGSNATVPTWTDDGKLRFLVGTWSLSVNPSSPDRIDTIPGEPGAAARRAATQA